jgi:hypothetical protein
MKRLLGRIAAVENASVLRLACVLGLLALPLMVASVFRPTVWPVLAALSIGQVIGTLSFTLYLIAIARDLRVGARLRDAPTQVLRPDADSAPRSHE